MHRVVCPARHQPFDWDAALTFLSRRAVAGVEVVESRSYHRTIRCADQTGTLDIASDEASSGLVVTVHGLHGSAVEVAVERVKRMFDLDADLPAIQTHLERDQAMAKLVASHPGMRVFRGWDPFEVAARSVIGQQVTVARARQLNGTLVARCGSPVSTVSDDDPHRLFPTPQEVVGADLSGIGMPGARVTALKNIATAVLADGRLLTRAGSIEETVTRLRTIGGIGDWTAHYIAMRACGEPDAFPASDVGLLRGAADAIGRRPTTRELSERAERWRPWRAYAAHLLWANDGGSGTAVRIDPRRRGSRQNDRPVS